MGRNLIDEFEEMRAESRPFPSELVVGSSEGQEELSKSEGGKVSGVGKLGCSASSAFD